MIPKINKRNDGRVNPDSVFSPEEIYGIELTMEGIGGKELDKFVKLLSRMEEGVEKNGESEIDS